MKPASSLMLRPAGGRAAVVEATRAQRLIWDCLQFKGPDDVGFNDGGLAPVPPSADLDAVAAVVTRFLLLHDVLRTTFCWRAGRLWQVVAGAGTVPLPIYSSTPEQAQETADALVGVLRATPLRVWDEWPVRMAIVVAGGVPRFVVVVYHRIALDRDGVRLVAAHMGKLLAGESVADVGQPIDQALRECSAAGRAARGGMVAQLRQDLLASPPSCYDYPVRPPAPERVQRLNLWSPAASLAVEAIAVRHRVSSSAVLLAATGTALSQYTGHTDLMINVAVENRADETRRLVGTLAVETPVRLDLTGASWPEALTKAFAVSVRAHLSAAGYDPVSVNALRRAAGLAHGAYLDLGTYFNDAREGPPVAVRETAERLRDRMAETTIKRVDGWARPDLRFQLGVYGTPGDMQLSLWCDTAYFPPPDMRELLMGIERLLVGAYAAAGNGSVAGFAGVTPAPRAPTAVRHARGGWVDLAGCRQLWRQLVRGPAAVFAEEAAGAGGYQLTAYAAGQEYSAADLHHQFVAMLGDRTDVRPADRYICTRSAPGEPGDLASWRQLPIAGDDDGRQPDRRRGPQC